MIGLTSIIWVSTVAFLLCLVLTPIVRDGFLRLGILDHPDGSRKRHLLAVPRVGGIAIALSYVAAYAISFAAGGTGVVSGDKLDLVLRLLPAAGVIFATGLFDDLWGLRPLEKLGGQLTGALLALWGGVRIVSVGGLEIPEVLGLVATVVWLIGCTNAFNLIDGLDGLASGMGLFTTLTIFLAALLHGNQTLALATLPLAGSLLGFLRYNFNPASVFLGDSGSLLVGFLLGCYGAIWGQKSVTLLGLTAPLMALAIPLLDVSLSIVRRWLRGKPIFDADCNHIHHRLLDRGLTHRSVVLVLYAMCGVYATLSLLQSLTENRFGGLILVLFCAVTWIGIQNLGYFEFGLASRALRRVGFRRAMQGQIVLHNLDQGVSGAKSVEDCWQCLIGGACQLGFARVEARLRGCRFERDLEAGSRERLWQIRIPLNTPGREREEEDYVELYRSFQATPLSPIVGALVELLRTRLASQLAWISVPNQDRVSLATSHQTDLPSLINLAQSLQEPQPLLQRDASTLRTGTD